MNRKFFIQMVIAIFDIGEKTCYIDRDVLEYIREKYGDKPLRINTKGYLDFKIHINNKRKNFEIHRLVFEALGENIPDKKDVDHIDRNPLNNTKDNLRLVSRNINVYNSKKRNTNTSGFIGVSFNRPKDYTPTKKYVAHLGINYRKICLGYFDTKIEAAYAYDVAKKLITDLEKMKYNNVEDQLDVRVDEEKFINTFTGIKAKLLKNIDVKEAEEKCYNILYHIYLIWADNNEEIL